MYSERGTTPAANQHLQSDPAKTSLFHAERLWRGAADVQRWAL